MIIDEDKAQQREGLLNTISRPTKSAALSSTGTTRSQKNGSVANQAQAKRESKTTGTGTAGPIIGVNSIRDGPPTESGRNDSSVKSDLANHERRSDKGIFIPTTTTQLSSDVTTPRGSSFTQPATSKKSTQKRSVGDDDDSSTVEKRHCSTLVMTNSIDPAAVLGSPSGEQTPQIDTLRTQFRSRWALKFPTFNGWARLDRFASIGTGAHQEPYAELDTIMNRIQWIGTSTVQAGFARSVSTWVSSLQFAGHDSYAPTHLQHIPGLEAEPFQRFWKALEISKRARGFEDMATLLRRKSLVDLISAYNEVIAHVRRCAAVGKPSLPPGVRAGAKAREILFSILFPESESRARMRSSFNYDQQCANPYMKLCKNFGNVGILAMIPSRINETDYRSTDARFAAFLEILNLVRPDLRGPRLEFCGNVIETVAGGGVLDGSTLHKLNILATPNPLFHSLEGYNEALEGKEMSAQENVEAENTVSVEELYRSADDKSQLAKLPDVDRQQILASRSELILREWQDRMIDEHYRGGADSTED